MSQAPEVNSDQNISMGLRPCYTDQDLEGPQTPQKKSRFALGVGFEPTLNVTGSEISVNPARTLSLQIRKELICAKYVIAVTLVRIDF